MSRDTTKGAVTYEPESVFGEAVAMSGSPTWRLPVLDRVDVSGLSQEKVDSVRVVQYANGCTRYIPMQKGGGFRTRLYLTGHGSTTASSITLAKLAGLLRYVFGYSGLSASAGTTCNAGWTVNSGTVAASNTFSAGSIAWFGSKRDGLADGQPAVITTHSGITVTLRTDLPGAPANTHVMYSGDMIYRPETPSDPRMDVEGLRFQLLTPNIQYTCHGCFARGATLAGTGPNELLTIDIDWGVAWWEEVVGTFPTTVATDEFTPLPNAAGSMFFQTRGTTTRATRNYRSLSVDVRLGIAEQVGPGAVDRHQAIVGAKRTPDNVGVTWTEDADAPTASPALAALWAADTAYHMLVGWTVFDGQRVAMYLPSVEFMGARPPQADGSGINRVTGNVRACTGPNTGSELELSAYRIGIG